MGSVTVKTKETVGNAFYETEYIFSESIDFLAFEADKREEMKSTAQSFSLNDLFGGNEHSSSDLQSSTEDLEGDEESPIVSTRVKKKGPTKH